MPKAWVDVAALKQNLAEFFASNRSELREFGNTVNQTFEAFVFTTVIKWYHNNGWTVEFKHPDKKSSLVKLKFSTRGEPRKYTYAICSKGDMRIQVRHGLRVATKHHRDEGDYNANVVLDVAVISDNDDIFSLKSDNHLEHSYLITFGEAKHMSAFAELVANFIGLVHEMMPELLDIHRPLNVNEPREHPAPFLYVSGYLYPTARGILETIRNRGYDIDIYSNDSDCKFELRASF